MHPKAIILDLDDTLIGSSHAYQIALGEVGIEIESDSYCAARREVKTRLGFGHVSANNRTLYFKQLSEMQGQFTARSVLDRVERYEQALCAVIAQEWRRGHREEIIAALSVQFKLIILTNENTRTQLKKISAIDPDGTLFPLVVTSEEIGVEKPDRRAFHYAASRLGLDITRCCVVGDSWKDDIEPALSLGCSVVWSQEYRRESMPIPVSVPTVTRFDEAAKWISSNS